MVGSDKGQRHRYGQLKGACVPSPYPACEDDMSCRVCFETHPEDDLVSPCKCRGSQEYIHLRCLRRWQKSAMASANPERAYVCGVCSAAFRPEYALDPWASALHALTSDHGVGALLGSLARRVAHCLCAAVAGALWPAWLCKSIALVALSFVVPYCFLAYYGLLLTLLASQPIILPFPSPSPLSPLSLPPVPGLNAGKLLVASPRIASSSIFAESCVLLLEHSPGRGATGVILNKALPTEPIARPSHLLCLFGHCAQSDAIEAASAWQSGDRWSMGLGGPMEPSNVMLMLMLDKAHDLRHHHASTLDGEVAPGLVLLGRLHVLDLPDDLGRTSGSMGKALLGYAAWAPGQLETEIRRGDWLLMDGSRASGVAKGTHTWEELVTRLTRPRPSPKS